MPAATHCTNLCTEEACRSRSLHSQSACDENTVRQALNIVNTRAMKIPVCISEFSLKAAAIVLLEAL